MKFENIILSIIIIFTIPSCKNEGSKAAIDNNAAIDKTQTTEIQEKKFPLVKELSAYQNTQFISTLEEKIPRNKNSIYCATLLFAWNEIRKQFNSPLIISDLYPDLKILNNSLSFKNVLKDNEYKASGKIEGDSITASAEFNKSLPFEFKLKSFKNELTFDGQKVSSFGVNGFESYEQVNIVSIIYYKNDKNFIVKLYPKDKEHEIILFMSDQNYNSIAEMTTEIEKLTAIGMTEMKDEKKWWKYYFKEGDMIVIPKFNFNIETDYTTLGGNYFISDQKDFIIKRVWQRTAFILDESGAEIESEAAIVAEPPAMEEESEMPKPKKMVFDKPFLILLKRIDAKNPYFGLWTTNTELMMKE